MSRGDELRAKFAAKAAKMDGEYIKFLSSVVAVIDEEFGCDIESTEWINELYLKAAELGLDNNVEKDWIKNHVDDMMPFVDNPPVDMRDEITWPCHDGIPMTFVSQCVVPTTKTSIDAGIANTMQFVFSAKATCLDGGFEIKYRILDRELGGQTAEDHYREEADRLK